jgi:hypothetical protein
MDEIERGAIHNMFRNLVSSYFTGDKYCPGARDAS